MPAAPRCLVASLVLALSASAQTTWTVDDDAGPLPGSGSAADPFRSIQRALDAAAAGDAVVVLPGVYREHVVMKAGVDLLGSGAALSTIDAGGSGTAVVGADDALLDGFRITGAGGPGECAVDLSNGSSPTISNNVIEGNRAPGVVLLGSRAVLTGNRIVGEPGSGDGCPCDPLVVVQSGATIRRNTIDASDPRGNLHAIAVSYVAPGMTESFRIEDNLVVGTILYAGVGSAAPLANVTRGNVILSADGFSPALDLASSEDVGRITNNTIVGGGGILARGSGTSAAIEGNIVAFGSSGIAWSASGTWLIAHNDVFGNATDWSGIPDQTGRAGNVSADPLFVDLAGGDLRLRALSPCVDAGGPGGDPLALDRGDVPRVLDGDLDGSMRVDMGAHELTNLRLAIAGDLAPGGELVVRVEGKAGLQPYLVIGDETATPGLLKPWGPLFVALPFALEAQELAPAPSTERFPIPPVLVLSTDFTLQAVGFDAPLPAGFSPGNLSNLERIAIR